MSTHVKRSPAFKAHVEQLMREIERMNGMRVEGKKGDTIAEIWHVLKYHTTDSPCMVKAADDEPVFVLRGQDELAPDVVEAWAKEYDRSHMLIGGQAKLSSLKRRKMGKAKDARMCAIEMRAYPNRKKPD